MKTRLTSAALTLIATIVASIRGRFGWPFAAIVLTAHAAFGAALVLLLRVMTPGLRHRSVVLESAAHREHAPPQVRASASRSRL
jgi:hypothetical protein